MYQNSGEKKKERNILTKFVKAISSAFINESLFLLSVNLIELNSFFVINLDYLHNAQVEFLLINCISK